MNTKALRYTHAKRETVLARLGPGGDRSAGMEQHVTGPQGPQALSVAVRLDVRTAKLLAHVCKNIYNMYMYIYLDVCVDICDICIHVRVCIYVYIYIYVCVCYVYHIYIYI